MTAPDFIGIGFQRCASTWIRSCLWEHPEVGIFNTGVHFFSENFHRGADWYFQTLKKLSNHKIVVDLSVSYGYPENISSFVNHINTIAPHSIVFASVRQPVERAFSDYRRSLFQGLIPPNTTFEEALFIFPELSERGHYRSLIEPLVEAIGKERLQIFFYEDIQHNPIDIWVSLCTLCNVNPAFQPRVLKERVNHIGNPRNRWLLNVLRTTSRFFSITPGIRKSWEKLKARPIWQKMARMMMKEEELNVTSLPERLKGLFEDDISYLEGLTGRDLDNWRGLS